MHLLIAPDKRSQRHLKRNAQMIISSGSSRKQTCREMEGAPTRAVVFTVDSKLALLFHQLDGLDDVFLLVAQYVHLVNCRSVFLLCKTILVVVVGKVEPEERRNRVEVRSRLRGVSRHLGRLENHQTGEFCLLQLLSPSRQMILSAAPSTKRAVLTSQEESE